MMDNGTAGLSTPDVQHEQDSPNLADAVGDMFGDYLPMGELDVPASSESGDPPADDPASRQGSEGSAADAEHAGTTADAAPLSDPDAAGQAPPAEDPLAGYTSLSYRVDGQERSVDGIREHPEYGAIVDPEYLPTLKQRLSERDHLFEQSKAQHERYQALEQATRWPIQNAHGQTEYVTGAQALEAQRVLMARSVAINQGIAGILDGTLEPTQLLAVDEQGRVVWNPDALQSLRDKIAFNADRAAWTAQRAFDPYRSASPTTTAPAEAPIAALAPSTIDATAQSLGLTTLTPEDKQFLAEQMEHYVRPTTEAERRQDPTIGPRIVDEKFVSLMKRVAQSRTEAAKAVQSAADITKQNAAKLQAAAKRPTNTAPAARQPAQPSRVQSADDAWDLAERATAAAMRQRA